jgi:hypothetical protein
MEFQNEFSSQPCGVRRNAPFSPHRRDSQSHRTVIRIERAAGASQKSAAIGPKIAADKPSKKNRHLEKEAASVGGLFDRHGCLPGFFGRIRRKRGFRAYVFFTSAATMDGIRGTVAAAAGAGQRWRF